MAKKASGDDEIKVLETKVVVLGHTGVGKTSMVNQYVKGHFSGQTTATIGAAFVKKYVMIDKYKIVLQIWDTAGQERFRSMAPMYYRGAHAAILVFDVTAKESLGKVAGWVEELQGHANEDIVLCVAANKCDLRPPNGEGAVSQAEAANYAKTINAGLFETSAKTGKGIDDLFLHVAKQLLKAETSRVQVKEEEEKRKNVKITGQNTANQTKGCCG